MRRPPPWPPPACRRIRTPTAPWPGPGTGPPARGGRPWPASPHARLACSVLEERAPLPALLTLLARVEDTNLLHRGGPEGLRFVREQAADILAGPEQDFLPRLEALDSACIARNLSPGGCADLLALALLLFRTKDIWEGSNF